MKILFGNEVVIAVVKRRKGHTGAEWESINMTDILTRRTRYKETNTQENIR